jgi:hypothetical protein
MAQLKEGSKAPSFEGTDQNGKTRKLSDYKGKKLILYFYPKDATPGCTKEACAFRDVWSKFETDGVLVLGVSAAHEISECQEVVDHIKGSPEAYSQVKGQKGKWSQYGLPDQLYGYDIVVEDTVKVTSRRGATSATRSFVMDGDRAYMLARPGGLVAAAGGPNFSTACLFMYEEMSVEEKQDEYHRRTMGNIVDDFDVVVTASASGFVFRDVLS